MAHRRRESIQKPYLRGFGAMPQVRPIYWWLLGGAVVLFLLSRTKKGQQVTSSVTATVEQAAASVKQKLLSTLTSAERVALKAVVPSKGEEFVDMAFEIAPKYDLNPLFVLAFLSVESGFKLSATETGDKGARCQARYSGTRLATAKSLPGVQIKSGYDAYRKETCEDALVPTTTGWGFGPMQLDWVSHSDFLKTPAGRTAAGQMEYAIKSVILPNINTIKRAIPNISDAKLFEATIAAYNAGATKTIATIKAGGDLTKLTAFDWYIPRVTEYMDKLSRIFGGDSTRMFS